ncbi:hypothetical protein [Dongia sp.]|uniref:hypothetical protein n=1 Tax=Dongia sp. TaxID=1977262 RepID=UPI0035B0CE33
MRALLLGCALTIAVSGAAIAQEILVKPDVACQVTAQYEPDVYSLHLRFSETANACDVRADDVAAALEAGIAAHDELALIFLGRYQDYPWIAEKILKLAAQDDRPGGRWDGAVGKARGDGNNNTYVARLISGDRKVPFATTVADGDVLWPLREVLTRHGYVLTGASVEKVIVMPVRSPIGGGKQRRLPVDALVHLRIAKKG